MRADGRSHSHDYETNNRNKARRLHDVPHRAAGAVEGHARKFYPLSTLPYPLPTYTRHARSPETRFEQQIARAFEPDARLEERLEGVALAVERVDDVRAGLDERGLEHVRKKGEDWVKGLVLLAARAGRVAVLDAREELGEDREVEDERSGEEGILGTERNALANANAKRTEKNDAPRTR